ncbi:thioredoxin domain-containing protein [Oxynema sp. CENA135]|uniref:DsbA family protein n=1 Tax=Oxynema sp. CENA135 TaxID=984206 RepID=UPI00190A5A0D|nr:thioredoxin domain-containing protein [Oxynema sp. CENA135]MBK4730065.1 thioredoxin domain-containing protein [Oxynema sp. CENA135]
MYPFRFISFILCTLLVCSTVLTSCTTSNSATDDTQLEQKVLEVIRENPEVILESVQQYQQQKEEQMQQARQKFLQQMLENPGSTIEDSPTKGASDRKIVLLEFSDFQCPFCARAHETVKTFMEKHNDTVTLAYKHLPLASIHPQAIPASKAAWAAQQQDKFWDYYDALFEQQNRLGEELYLEIARNLKLDLEQFNRDREGQAATNAIEKDLQLAKTLGINGTPFFIMNGETFAGAVELSEMENVLAKVQNSMK